MWKQMDWLKTKKTPNLIKVKHEHRKETFKIWNSKKPWDIFKQNSKQVVCSEVYEGFCSAQNGISFSVFPFVHHKSHQPPSLSTYVSRPPLGWAVFFTDVPPML